MILVMLEEFEFSDVYVRHAVDERPGPSDFTLHVHSRCELYFFISGKVEYLVEGSCYPLDRGYLLAMRPSESHAARILDCERYERYAVNFPTSYFSAVDPDGLLMRPLMDRPLGKGNLFTGRDIDSKLAERLFAELAAAKGPGERKLVSHTHLGMLLHMVAKAFALRGKAPVEAPGFLDRVSLYINDRLFESLSVEELAGHFNLSVSQFSRLFRKGFGSSPWEYILRKRLAAAREMLREGKSADAACESCGFSDYSSFYRAYIKYFHESPRMTKREG